MDTVSTPLAPPPRPRPLPADLALSTAPEPRSPLDTCLGAEPVDSFDRLDAILRQRPAWTTSWPTTRTLARTVRRTLRSAMRPLDEVGTRRLARLLGVAPGDLVGPFRDDVRSACLECGRPLSFVDRIETLIREPEDGADRAELAAILCGRRGYWITVAGLFGRPRVRCGGCGRMQTAPAPHHSHHCLHL